MRKAVFAGTFDPITSGHEEIIKKSSEMFDELVVALCVNVSKRAMFSVEKRLELLNATCKKYKNVKVYHLSKDSQKLKKFLDEHKKKTGYLQSFKIKWYYLSGRSYAVERW